MTWNSNKLCKLVHGFKLPKGKILVCERVCMLGRGGRGRGRGQDV